MAYHVVTRWGDSEEEPSEQRMREILAELGEHDPEHPDTWLSHESGCTLSVFESGRVTWENLGSAAAPRHLVGVSREKALSLWLKLSRGDISAIEQEAWCAGQAPPQSAEERARHAAEAAEATLAASRRFYESLGPERPGVPCRHAGCHRGAVGYSVLCRVHHFENIYDCPCPFQD
jgi:hypothetical protein